MNGRCATSAAGAMQRLLSAATAASALPLGVEIYVNHYGGSFGNKWMWTPVVLSPALTRRRRRRRASSERAARTVLPALSAVFFARRRRRACTSTCAARRASPAGCGEATYNLVDGPAGARARAR